MSATHDTNSSTTQSAASYRRAIIRPVPAVRCSMRRTRRRNTEEVKVTFGPNDHHIISPPPIPTLEADENVEEKKVADNNKKRQRENNDEENTNRKKRKMNHKNKNNGSSDRNLPDGLMDRWLEGNKTFCQAFWQQFCQEKLDEKAKRVTNLEEKVKEFELKLVQQNEANAKNVDQLKEMRGKHEETERKMRKKQEELKETEKKLNDNKVEREKEMKHLKDEIEKHKNKVNAEKKEKEKIIADHKKLREEIDELKQKMKTRQVATTNYQKMKALLADFQRVNDLEIEKNSIEFEKEARNIEFEKEANLEISIKAQNQLMEEVDKLMKLEQKYKQNKLLLKAEKEKNKKLTQLELKQLENDKEMHTYKGKMEGKMRLMEQERLEFRERELKYKKKIETLTECVIIGESKGFKMKCENNTDNANSDESDNESVDLSN